MKLNRTISRELWLGQKRFSWLEGDQALMQRVELVLSTPLGTLPWRPDFGCGLWDMMGTSATPDQLARLRWSIETALARWVPEALVDHCRVVLKPDASQLGNKQSLGLQSPIENGLVHLGVTAQVEIDLGLSVNKGLIRAKFVV